MRRRPDSYLHFTVVSALGGGVANDLHTLVPTDEHGGIQCPWDMDRLRHAPSRVGYMGNIDGAAAQLVKSWTSQTKS